MKMFDLRDLETGEVIARNGADRSEILKYHKGRYCNLGSEPKGWKPPKGAARVAKVAPEPDEPDLDPGADNEIEE